MKCRLFYRKYKFWRMTYLYGGGIMCGMRVMILGGSTIGRNGWGAPATVNVPINNHG